MRRQATLVLGPVQPVAPNDVWTIDFKGWWRLGNGERCEPLTVRDAFSKYILAATVPANGRTQTMIGEFNRLFQLYGLPKVIKSDNGTPFAAHGVPLGLSTRWQLETPIRCCSALKYNSLIFFGPQWGYAILNRTSRHTTVSLSCVGELNGRRLRSANRLIPPNRARSRHSRPVLRVTSYSRHNAVKLAPGANAFKANSLRTSCFIVVFHGIQSF